MVHVSYPNEKVNALSERELLTVSRAAHIAIATRCAERVFPLIGFEGNLNFWKRNAAYYVDVVECAILAGRLVACGDDKLLKCGGKSSIEILDLIEKEAKNAAEICPTFIHLRTHVVAYTALSSVVYIAESFPGGAAASALSAAFLANESCADYCRIDAQFTFDQVVAYANRSDFEFLKSLDNLFVRLRGKVKENNFHRMLYPGDLQLSTEHITFSKIENAFAEVERTEALERWKSSFLGAPESNEQAIERILQWYQKYF